MAVGAPPTIVRGLQEVIEDSPIRGFQRVRASNLNQFGSLRETTTVRNL